MNTMQLVASSLLGLRVGLGGDRPAWTLLTNAVAAQDAPLHYLLILSLDFLIAGLIAVTSGLVALRVRSRRELDDVERRLALQETRFLALVDNGNDGILLLSPKAQILYSSPGAQAIYGLSGNSRAAENMLCFVHQNDRKRLQQALDLLVTKIGATFTIEVRCQRADESWHWTECTIKNLLEDPAVGAIVTTCRDIEIYKKCEQDLTALAVTDALTGLPNYRRLMEILESEIRRFHRTGRPWTVLLLDLDGLKQINDTFGHLVGSRALRRVGEVLSTSCRSIDTPARYGGDEFVVVLPESSLEVARGVADRIADRLRAQSEAPLISVSVGMALCPDDGTTAESLLQKADMELYKMKSIYNSLQDLN